MLDGNTNDSILLMLGEVRSDVKALLANSAAHDKRIGAVERKIWTASGAAAFLGMFVTTAFAKMFGWH